MLEKLSIRFMVSFIVMWFIIQLLGVVFELDAFIFIMMFVHALCISLIIESLYTICRQYIKYTIYMIIGFIIINCLVYYCLGVGIYFGVTTYIVLSIIIDLWREYRITRLLKQAIDSHV